MTATLSISPKEGGLQHDAQCVEVVSKPETEVVLAPAPNYPEAKRIHLILDNYRIHSSRQVELVLAKLEGQVQLHFLPPYCPDYNRIERVWRDLHENVTRNHQCRTMTELMKEVRWYLRKRDKALKRLYASKKPGLPGLRKAI